jgi:hypothetical protein
MTIPARPPLKRDGATPSDLKRALDALSRQDEDSARIARVGARLGPILDAGIPLAAGRPLLLRFAAHVPKVLRVVLAGSVIGAALWLTQKDPAPAPPIVAPASVSVAEIRATLTPPATFESAAPAAPEVAALATEASAAPIFRDGAGIRASNAAGKATRSTSASKALARSKRHVEAAQEAAQSFTSTPTEFAVAAMAPSVAATAPAPAPADAERERAAPVPRAPTEAELLVDARRKLSASPAEAMLVLQQHAQRFATGMLAPEREVMAIEALRALGRAAEAEVRLQAFRQRYPDSLRRRRLAR